MQVILRRPGRLARIALAVAAALAVTAPAAHAYEGQPTVTGVSPATGPTSGGTEITITGTNLSGVDIVEFQHSSMYDEGRGTQVTAVSDTEVRVKTPDVVFPGKRSIFVDDPESGSNESNEAFFDFTGPASGNLPEVMSLTPSHGPGSGGNFVVVDARFINIGLSKLTVGGQDVLYQSNYWADPNYKPGDPVRFGFRAPSHAAGKVDVRLTTDVGESLDTAIDDYTYDTGPGPAPVITSLAPPVARPDGGTTVIRGTDLAGANGVTVDGEPATFYVLKDGISVSLPAHDPGTVDVRVTTAAGTSENTAADDLTYLGPDDYPSATALSPASGPIAGGTVVTLTGKNLDLVDRVSFFGTGSNASATNLVHVSSTQLRFTTPASSTAAVSTLTFIKDTFGPIGTVEPKFTYTEQGPTVVKYAYDVKGSTRLKNLTTGVLPLTGVVDAELTVGTGAITGQVKLNPTSANLVALGLLPLKASIVFTQEGAMSGTLTPQRLTVTSKQAIGIRNVTLWGLKLVTGTTCRTARASSITMQTAGAFAPLSGGLLTGTYAIGNLTGCGGLNTMVSNLTAGSGNPVALQVTPKATPVS